MVLGELRVPQVEGVLHRPGGRPLVDGPGPLALEPRERVLDLLGARGEVRVHRVRDHRPRHPLEGEDRHRERDREEDDGGDEQT